MAKESTYLNFPRSTEEAFNFNRKVFGGEFGDACCITDT
jgi:PhnB protein